MADHSQKTEQPTKRRLDKARQEGNFVATRELLSYAQFAVAILAVLKTAPWWMGRILESLQALLLDAFRSDLSLARLSEMVLRTAAQLLLPLLGGAVALLACVLGLQMILTQGGVAGQKLAPDLKRLSPLSKGQQMWTQNRMQLLQAALTLPVILACLVYELWRHWPVLATTPAMTLRAGAAAAGNAVADLLWHSIFILGLFAAGEFAWQTHRYRRDLRMTKQEIRDEFKEQEGNPHLKQRMRQMQRDLLRRKMMGEVPKATAIIVNPTHYAVAIRYQLDSPAAPRVIAKGKNYLAARIRERAMEHQIPIVENPPLARALYKAVPVGQEIPPHLFRAVAEILAYIYRLMNGRLPGS